MATAARGSGRASATRLLLLLLLALLWAPAGVRAVPDEDLSLRNKEPPAPAQQLQPQPAAVQGPEPARAEVSRTGQGGPAAEPMPRVPGSRPPGALRPAPAAGGGRGTRRGSLGWRRLRALLPGPGLARLLMGEGMGAPSTEPAVNLQSRSIGMLLEKGPRDDQTCPKELQILIPGRKFVTEDSGRRFLFPEDKSIGHFIVETANSQLLTQIELCMTYGFCQIYMDYEEWLSLFKNVLWLAGSSPQERRGIIRI